MKKINLLLPIAGRAQRFLDKGYSVPKPLILADGKHIIDWSLDSIDLSNCNLIFCVRLDHINNFSIDDILRQKFGDDIKIVVVDHITEGALNTCLLAKDYIDNDNPLVIYTPDTYFLDKFDPMAVSKDIDGLLLTFKANSPAHSYAKIDNKGYVTKTAEKEVISENAAVGVYYYKHGTDFVKYGNKLIDKNIRVNNEFYICPMYNLLIEDDLKVKCQTVEKNSCLGTPEELEFFIDYVAPRFGTKPVALCSDHSGYELKEKAKSVLKDNNIDYVDFGCYVKKSCDYGDYVNSVVKELDRNSIDFALGFCRTGQGINILANKTKNVRAALVFNEYMAEYSIRHNCANFFSIPSKYVDTETLDKMVKVLKKSMFDGGRHMTRMKKATK